jgi:hypothetical protein
VPFREWINLTHRKTFIHGPFDFATVRGCKSRDRIAQIDWDVLVSHKDMLQNDIPRFDLPSYSIHVDRGAHVAYIDASASAQISSAADGSPLFWDDEWRRLQKVFVSISNPTPLWFFFLRKKERNILFLRAQLFMLEQLAVDSPLMMPTRLMVISMYSVSVGKYTIKLFGG